MLRIHDVTNLVLMSNFYCNFIQISKLLIWGTVLTLLTGPTVYREYFCWITIFILCTGLQSNFVKIIFLIFSIMFLNLTLCCKMLKHVRMVYIYLDISI